MMATSPMESLSSGFIINIELFFITLLLALPLGLVITFCSMSKFKPLKWLSRTFVWIIRGTPLMLQLFVVLYAPGLLFSLLLIMLLIFQKFIVVELKVYQEGSTKQDRFLV